MERSDRPVLTVRELMLELSELDPDAPVLMAVVKYPHLFPVAQNWEDSDACELVPIEDKDDILVKDGMVLIVAELTDYEEEMRAAFS